MLLKYQVNISIAIFMTQDVHSLVNANFSAPCFLQCGVKKNHFPVSLATFIFFGVAHKRKTFLTHGNDDEFMIAIFVVMFIPCRLQDLSAYSRRKQSV